MQKCRAKKGVANNEISQDAARSRRVAAQNVVCVPQGRVLAALKHAATQDVNVRQNVVPVSRFVAQSAAVWTVQRGSEMLLTMSVSAATALDVSAAQVALAAASRRCPARFFIYGAHNTHARKLLYVSRRRLTIFHCYSPLLYKSVKL